MRHQQQIPRIFPQLAVASCCNGRPQDERRLPLINLGIQPWVYHKTPSSVGWRCPNCVFHILSWVFLGVAAVRFLSHVTPLKRLSAVVLADGGCYVAVGRPTESVSTHRRPRDVASYLTQCFVSLTRLGVSRSHTVPSVQWLLHHVHLSASPRHMRRSRGDRQALRPVTVSWQHRPFGIPVMAPGSLPDQ